MIKQPTNNETTKNMIKKIFEEMQKDKPFIIMGVGDDAVMAFKKGQEQGRLSALADVKKIIDLIFRRYRCICDITSARDVKCYRCQILDEIKQQIIKLEDRDIK